MSTVNNQRPSELAPAHLPYFPIEQLPVEVLEVVFEVLKRDAPQKNNLKCASMYFYEVYWGKVSRLGSSDLSIRGLLQSSLYIHFGGPRSALVTIATHITDSPKDETRPLQSDNLGNHYFYNRTLLFIVSSQGEFHSIDLRCAGLDKVRGCHRHGEHLLVVTTKNFAHFCLNEEGVFKLKEKHSVPNNRYIDTSTLHQETLLLYTDGDIFMYDFFAQSSSKLTNVTKEGVRDFCSHLCSSGSNLFLLSEDVYRETSSQYIISPVILDKKKSCIRQDPDFQSFESCERPLLSELHNNMVNGTGALPQEPPRAIHCGRWFMDYAKAYIQVIDLQSGKLWMSVDTKIPSPLKIEKDFFFLSNDILFISWGKKISW